MKLSFTRHDEISIIYGFIDENWEQQGRSFEEGLLHNSPLTLKQHEQLEACSENMLQHQCREEEAGMFAISCRGFVEVVGGLGCPAIWEH